MWKKDNNISAEIAINITKRDKKSSWNKMIRQLEEERK